MIVCTRCGFQNEDSDTFCGSCAGFLEWSGQQVEEAVEPEPTPEPEPQSEPERAGFIDRVKDRIGISDREADGGEASGGAEPVPESTPGDGGIEPAAAAPVTPAAVAAASATTAEAAVPRFASPAPPPPGTSPAPDQSPAPTVTASAVAPQAPAPSHPAPPAALPPVASPATAAMAVAPSQAAPPTEAPPLPPGAPTRTVQSSPAEVPPAPSAPVAPVQPEAVKPAAVKARPTPRAKPASTREINPGDKVCSQCGEGNDPTRKFCRRCGASLQLAAVFSLPWYRRWWRELTAPKTRQAGDRPRVRRRAFGGAGPGWLTSWVTRIIILVVVVLIILTFVGPWNHGIRHRISRYYHDVVNVVHPTYNPVHPVSATGTSAAPGHPPGLAIDGAVNTSWQTGERASAVGQSIVIKFESATNVDKIGFLNGDQDNPAAFLTVGRPASVRLTFPGTHPYTKTLNLKDSPNFQSYTIKAKGATQVTITVLSVNAAPQTPHVAIAEVEFFKLK